MVGEREGGDDCAASDEEGDGSGVDGDEGEENLGLDNFSQHSIFSHCNDLQD